MFLAFVTATRATGLGDSREYAVVMAAAALDNAEWCPVCQDIFLFSFRKYDVIQFPSTLLNSCNKIRKLSPKSKGTIL